MSIGSGLLDRYIPERAWFDRRDDHAYAGTHGIGHITRVLVWSARLAELSEVGLRREELFWAAGLHDIKRHDDGIDREHGMRAGEWVLASFADVRPGVAAGLDLDLIASLCRDHVTSDERIRVWTPELKVLKDADGLDRVRIWDLDVSRLRLPASPEQEPQAWTLMQRSVDAGNTADAVRQVALEMELWPSV